MRFRRSHLLGLAGLEAGEIGDLLDRAETYWEAAGTPGWRAEPTPAIERLSVVNLILEPSTRTRCSFEIAEQRLGLEHLSVGSDGLSLIKGETLSDTGRTLRSMGVNVFVVRHPEVGAPAWLAEELPGVHVINAGDGTGEHPTQGLLDLLVLRRRWGSVEGRRVVIVGDVLHSRVARSTAHGLSALGAVTTLCGPAHLLPEPGGWPGATIADDFDEALAGADAVMALRIQRERFMAGEALPDRAAYRQRYGLTSERVARLSNDTIVIHPGPFNRDVEIDGEVVDGGRTEIWSQVRAGVAIRMATLAALGESRLEIGSPAEAGAGA
ncbi:MAG TPA: aspartate carbamoyltransferase catalytic subunit [Gemmatimonadota bacterium]|nr:aspartate carbamoyltransferase catalytic subunit [Gemmatimonadota bacterium]